MSDTNVMYPTRFRDAIVQVLRSPVFQFVFATAAATIIFFARAPSAYMTPVLFAEDWDWTTMVVTRGFWDTALHARQDYCIVGNIALVWLAIQLADVVWGDIFCAPQCLAVISYAFFGVVASLPVLLLRRQLRPAYCWAAWLLACSMPLGIHSLPAWSGFEILGRGVNVGYAFLVVAFVLVWYRNTEVQSWRSAALVDAGLLVCCATNPICIPLLSATVWPSLWRWLRHGASLGETVRNTTFISLCVLVIGCVAINGVPSATRPHHAEQPVSVSFDGFVEMAFARGLVYPLVWPWYRQLSTGITLLATAGLCVVLAVWTLPRQRPLIAAGVGAVLLVSVVLAMCRGELATCLGGYRNTFPDRYFYAQNLVMTLTLVAWASGIAERAVRLRWLSWLPLGGLVVIAVISIHFEPPWRISDSQFLMLDDGGLRVAARRCLREKVFVDGHGTRDPDGPFVEILVPGFRAGPIRLRRQSVERAMLAHPRHSLLATIRNHAH